MLTNPQERRGGRKFRMWRRRGSKAEVLLQWWGTIFFLHSWERKMMFSSSLVLSSPKVGDWKYLIGTCGGVVTSSLWELGSPPAASVEAPRVPAGCSRVWGTGKAASPDREPQGVERGRAAAWPARKKSCFQRKRLWVPLASSTLSPRNRPAQACTTGRGRGTLTSLSYSSWNGHSLGRGGRTLSPPFRHDPIQKCQTQLPGTTEIIGALNSCPSR